jgi:acyl-CoA synthetase (AMP-forming)/AMP-acid ligase II
VHQSLGDALRAAARGARGVTFVDLHEKERFVGWSDVFQRARRVAGALGALGVRPGDRVALVLPTGLSFIDAFFGVTLAGAIPAALAPPQRLGRLEEYHASTARMIEAAGARLVLTDARVRRLLGVAIERCRPALGCLVVDELIVDGPSLDALGTDATSFEVTNRPSDLAVIQYSSGSTVDPKPVALSHGNLMAQLASIEQVMPAGADGERVVVSWLPLHHDMGLIGCLLNAVVQAMPLVLIPSEFFLARPALWLRAISRHKATASAAPSFAYSLCLKRIKDAELEGVDLSSWRYALNGAEPVSVSILEEFSTRFARWGFDPHSLMPVYGMAEATLALTFPTRGRLARSVGIDPVRLARWGVAAEGSRRIASVGVPLPGVEVDIRDDDGHSRAPREAGRIWVRSPSVMQRYFGNERATRAALVDGWLDTGDLGFIAEEELFICGRAKDVVIIRGANHTPQEFEECLEAIEGVRRGCVVALGFVPNDDESGGGGEEQLLILAERAKDTRGIDPRAPTLEEELRSAILKRTGIRAHTIALLEQGTLPRTTSGKLRRSEALRRYLSGQLTSPCPPSMLRLLGDRFKSSLAFLRVRRAVDA